MAALTAHKLELLCCLAWLLAVNRVAKCQESKGVGGGPRVSYPPPICAVEGSSVSIPCTFSPLAPIRRVVWCKGHEICQGSTPSVYSSDAPPFHRFKYLGDKSGDCTLQIAPVHGGDSGTFRFRMEALDGRNHWTQRSGVNLTVTDAAVMRVVEARDADGVTLSCGSECSVEQLEVSWFKDGRLLSASGSSLRLRADARLSAEYRCALASHNLSLSEPYLWSGDDGGLPMVAMVMSALGATLGAALGVALLLCVLKSKRRQSGAAVGSGFCCCNRKSSDSAGSWKRPDDVSGSERARDARDGEELNYAVVHFKDKSSERAAKEAQLAVIYSSVALRG